MTTNKKSQYDIDEDKLIECVINLKENYNINNRDIFDIVKDRT